jgi:acyl-CoA hydrolase
MDRMTFLEPVHPGELMSFKASVNAVWRSSMEVGVRVEAERPRTGEVRHTSTAYLTMVALDDEGRPIDIPPLLTSEPDEIRREREAQTRRRNRLAERDEIRRARDS